MKKYCANYRVQWLTGLLASFLFILGGLVTAGATIADGAGDDRKSIDLIECGDQDLQIKILCNPRWQTRRGHHELAMVLAKTAPEEITVTISKSEERGLFYSDLTPAALQRVYGYKERFKYAKTRIKRQWVVRIEGHPQEDGNKYLLDYFLLQDTYLYRISYQAASYEGYRKYLPVFVQMMRSFSFLETK